MNAERLPRNTQLERSLLGRLILSGNGSIGEVAKRLRSRHFHDEHHRIIFAVLLEMHRAGLTVDGSAIKDYVKRTGRLDRLGGEVALQQLLGRLLEDPAAKDPAYAVSRIIDDARLRALLGRAATLQEIILAGNAEPERVRRQVTRIDRAARFDTSTGGARTTWTHADLLGASFPEVTWIAEGLVVGAGLTLLGAKKKSGKSWMALQLAQAVATGTPFLGRPTVKGKVLYLALEDGPRRLRDRLKMQHAPADLPIVFVTRIPPLDGEGMAELREMIHAERPVLVIIDTMARGKSGRVEENNAGPMSDLFGALQSLGQDSGAGILGVVHHGKTVTGDPGHDIRGSSAAPAAGDINIGIYKENNTRILRGEGRDLGDFEHRICFDAVRTWAWSIQGDHRDLARTEAEQDIITALVEMGKADAGALADYLNKSRPTVQDHLKRMREEGRIDSRQDEKYPSKLLYSPLPPYTPPYTHSPSTPPTPPTGDGEGCRTVGGVGPPAGGVA